MSNKVLTIALLLLFFFVATSSSMADLTAVQGQLRDIQLKLIGAKIKSIQEQIYGLNLSPISAAPTVSGLQPVTTGELSKSLGEQIVALEKVVTTLKPRLLDEKTAELEQKIALINQQLPTATGSVLWDLRAELQKVAVEYQNLQRYAKQALEDSIKERQAFVLREQIRSLQEKLTVLRVQEFGRSNVVQPAPGIPVVGPEVTTPTQVVQAELEKAQLKLIQAQVKAIQEKILQIRR